MKNKILLALLLLAGPMAMAQNTFPTSGNVGIGTLTPIGNFDIFDSRNTTTTPLISIRSNFHVSGNYGMIRFGDYTQTTDYQKGAIIYESVEGSARGKFHIALENTDSPGSVALKDARLTILSAGNVGIGITNPTDKLQVEGNQFSLRNAEANAGVIFNVNTFGHPAIIPTNGNGTVDKHLLLAPFGGNVGIGTTTPNEKLAVNGKIRAKEIKVETANWPDYVFEEGYKVGKLEELESYIKANKRLPDMPSAKEAETNGVELGEMNKLLLKKQEELVLHLIEQNKRLENQQQEIDQLKKLVAKLLDK